MSEDKRPATTARPLERNKAIIQARNLLEIPEWVIFSSQVTTIEAPPGSAEQSSSLVSVSIMTPGRKILLDSCMRPTGEVTGEMLRRHGTNQAKLRQSVPAESLLDSITALCEKRDVLCWDLPLQVRNLNVIASEAGKASPFLRAVSLQSCYARFVGEQLGPATFKIQPLPGGSCSEKEDISALKECENIIELVYTIAGSSQISEAAEVVNRNWSSAFYKPKVGAAQKIRSFFGLTE